MPYSRKKLKNQCYRKSPGHPKTCAHTLWTHSLKTVKVQRHHPWLPGTWDYPSPPYQLSHDERKRKLLPQRELEFSPEAIYEPLRFSASEKRRPINRNDKKSTNKHANELQMALNHRHLKKIRHSIANQLNVIRNPQPQFRSCAAAAAWVN